MADGERFILLRGANGRLLYVRKLEPDVGIVRWTDERPRAHRFTDRGQAELIQGQIVERESFAVAVVPA